MAKRALVTAAHADDETLGCGGTIARLVEEGWEVHLQTFTTGGRGKARWADDACVLLGIDRYRPEDKFPDNAMDSVPLLSVVRHIEAFARPPYDIILTHWTDCLNVDHQIVARATLTAFRLCDYPHRIYGYPVPCSSAFSHKPFDGKTYVSLTGDQVDKKLAVLEQCYLEEMRDPPHPRSFGSIIIQMRQWGSEVGVKNAEKFKLYREVW